MNRFAFFIVASLSICAAARGVSITAQPGDDLQADLNAVAGGGILSFGAGTFNITSALTVPSGATVQGAPNFGTHLVFAEPKAQPYAFIIPAGAEGITIEGLDIHASNDVVSITGRGCSAIRIIDNRLQFGAVSQGLDVYGIWNTLNVDDLEIEWNDFHDSLGTDRDWQVWSISNSHLDHNLCTNVHDGGHFEDPGGNDTWSWNYMAGVVRMGQELQGWEGSNAAGMICDHDVVINHPAAFNDSEGVSFCCNATPGCVLSNGYFQNNDVGNWGKMINGAVGGPNRMGYGIEAISPGLQVKNCTVILTSLSACGLSAGEPCTVQSCKFYDTANCYFPGGMINAGDGTPAGEPPGSVTPGAGTLANAIYATANAPPPPANTFAGTAIYAASNDGAAWTPSWTQGGVVPVTQPASQPSGPQAPTVVETIELMSDGTFRIPATQP